MYSTKVIEASVARYEEKAGHRLVRIENGKRDEWRAHLDRKLARHETVAETLKQLTSEEKVFVRNERVLSMIDFRYWSHYATIERDGGGVTNFDRPWESTEIFLRFIAGIEQEQHDHVARGEMVAIADASQPKPAVPGILVAINKARQTAATTIGRLITLHRVTTQHQRRALSASVNEEKIKVMYDRDKLCYDNLPWYMKPDVLYDEKCAHLHFDKFNSRISYQVSSQKSGSGGAGVGVGSQIDIHHLTELSTWLGAASLPLDFFPTIPRSIHTFGLEESTPYGRGNWWHMWTEKVRRGQVERWRYCFIPWYAEQSKYRALPPEGWQPSELSMLHAQKVYDTSHEFIGRALMLPRENLYWYEKTRAEYQADGNLNWFLTNFPATPEESFQHSSPSIFPADLLADLRDHSSPGAPHELVRASA